MEYQDRVNRPLGMSDVDLLIYDKDIYTMYRTNEGLETDAFRYDPVVSAGMLASDYAFAQGMQWVNLLTPASQDKINPGDGLIVPVQTYDNYENLPPIEKYLTHEVSYTANQLNIARNEGLHNEFVGDFNNYFNGEIDGESGFTKGTSLETPVKSGSLFTAPIKNPIKFPIKFPVKPNFNDVSGNIAQVKAKLAACVKFYAKPILIKNQTGQVERRLLMPRNIDPCKKLRDRLKYLMSLQQQNAPEQVLSANISIPHTIQSSQNLIQSSVPSAISVAPQQVAQQVAQPVSQSSEGEIISGGFMGGGGVSGGDAGVMSSGGEAPEVQPEAQAPASEVSRTSEAAKGIDYMPIVFGVIIFALIGYYYANTKNKDVKIFAIAGAIIGGILGYLYSTRTKSESGYLVDDFYR
jgi:hypothetical protein